MKASLVSTGRLLTSLQLLHIPTANVQVPIILIHAACEVLDINSTRSSSFLTRRLLSTILTTLSIVINRLLSLLDWCCS
jgi:hypothetical protein